MFWSPKIPTWQVAIHIGCCGHLLHMCVYAFLFIMLLPLLLIKIV
jgi:hypothetical protein